MTALALAQQDDPRGSALPQQKLVNLCVEEGSAEGGKVLLGRPSLGAYATAGNGPLWGSWANAGAFGGDLFVASGGASGRLYRIAAGGGVTDLGAMPATYPVLAVVAPEAGQLALVANAILYVYDGTTLTKVLAFSDTGEAMPDWQDIVYLAGRFVLPQLGSQGCYYSAIEDATTIEQLNFFSADAAPGYLTGAAALAGQIALLCTDHVEWWQPTSDASAPYARGQGQGYARGCAAVASIVVLDNALWWVGDDRVVYRSGAVPQRVSNKGVEEQLRLTSGIVGVCAYAVLLGGHAWYVMNVPNQGTWAYDVSARVWAQWAGAYGGGAEPILPAITLCWPGTFGVTSQGVTWVVDGPGNGLGGAGSGAVFVLGAAGAVDVTGPLARLVSAWQGVGAGRPRCDNVSLQVTTAGSGQVGMRWSDDQGQSWTEWKLRTATPGGRLVWNRLGRMASPGRLFQFALSDNVAVAIEGAEVNAAFA